MRPPRFSLSALVGVVLFCGVALAALRWPSALAANAVFSILLGALVVALIGVANTRGAKRAYWSGFAIGGWVYLLASIGPWLDSSYSAHLLTTAVLHIAEGNLVAPSPPPPAPAPAQASAAMGSAMMMGYGSSMMGSAGMMPGSSPPTKPVDITLWDLWTQVDRNAISRSVGSFSVDLPGSYARIGHSFSCLLIALGCGAMGRRFYSASTRTASPDGLASVRPSGAPAAGASS